MDLASAIARELAPDSVLSDAQTAAIQRAAGLALLAEQARARALRRKRGSDLIALARIEGTADRALRAARALKHKQPTSSLSDYLAERGTDSAKPPDVDEEAGQSTTHAVAPLPMARGAI